MAGVIPAAGCSGRKKNTTTHAQKSAASRAGTQMQQTKHANAAAATNLEAGAGGGGGRGPGGRVGARGRPGEQVGRGGVRLPHRHRPLHCSFLPCLLPVAADSRDALARQLRLPLLSSAGTRPLRFLRGAEWQQAHGPVWFRKEAAAGSYTTRCCPRHVRISLIRTRAGWCRSHLSGG